MPNELLLDPIIVITWNFEHEGEFFHLIQLIDLLRSNDHNIVNGREIRMYIPYMPYARQDKQVSNDATFAGLTFAELLSMLNVNEISTVDVHNPKIYKGLVNFKNYPVDYIINDIIKNEKINIVVFPDKSARTRYETDVIKCFPNIEILHGEKVRNQATGNIESLSLVGSMSWALGKSVGKPFRYLVVDDICDGGASPIRTAQGLNLQPNDYLIGYFSHCLCTKGTDIIREAGYSKLYDYRGLFKDFEKEQQERHDKAISWLENFKKEIKE